MLSIKRSFGVLAVTHHLLVWVLDQKTHFGAAGHPPTRGGAPFGPANLQGGGKRNSLLFKHLLGRQNATVLSFLED
jgi:hypothetical protein